MGRVGDRSERKWSNVLVAVVGMSPAVLTETVWALAHRDKAIIPEQVIVITTVPGMRAIRETLFDSGEWSGMLEELKKEGLVSHGKLRFGLAQDHIRLLPSPDGSENIDDIASPESSAVAADFIMRTLREFTENPETRVIASIAGGRKTMSALMMSCMSLLGRAQDSVCHVLVDPPYDQPGMAPAFLYPARGRKHLYDGRSYRADKAQLRLIELPFVRMRGWYEQRYRNIPESYSTLVQRFSGIAPSPLSYPPVRIDLRKGLFRVGEVRISLSSSEFAFMAALLSVRKRGGAFDGWLDIGEEIERIRADESVGEDCQWLREFRARAFAVEEDTRKIAARVRGKLNRSLGRPELTHALVPNLREAGRELYPLVSIAVRGL